MLSHWALALECTYGRLMVSSIWSHCISISNIQTLFIKLSVPASTGAQSTTLWSLFLLIINQCLKDSLVSHPSVWLVKIHILTSEMPVDELERTVRQRRCTVSEKAFPPFFFLKGNSIMGCILHLLNYPPSFCLIFSIFFLKMSICRVASKQTQKEEQFITLSFWEINRNNHNNSEWIFSQSVSESLNGIKTYWNQIDYQRTTWLTWFLHYRDIKDEWRMMKDKILWRGWTEVWMDGGMFTKVCCIVDQGFLERLDK